MKSRTFAAKYFSGLIVLSAVSAGIMIQQYYDFKERRELRERPIEHYDFKERRELRERPIEQPEINNIDLSEIEMIISHNYGIGYHK